VPWKLAISYMPKDTNLQSKSGNYWIFKCLRRRQHVPQGLLDKEFTKLQLFSGHFFPVTLHTDIDEFSIIDSVHA
jgi:hypothetical protein